MYFQFLIEDLSTEILINHVMTKLQSDYNEKEILYDCKSFNGIGHLVKEGKPLDHKTGKLLNDLPMYLRAFNKILCNMEKAALVIVLDNDKRDPEQFRKQLIELANKNGVSIDYLFCVAIKEMEAWLLGDMEAIEQAYPQAKKGNIRGYIQDGICDTWEVLANIVYPGGVTALKKKAGGSYTEIGKAKREWAEQIGVHLDFSNNQSPSFQYFIQSIKQRIEAA